MKGECQLDNHIFLIFVCRSANFLFRNTNMESVMVDDASVDIHQTRRGPQESARALLIEMTNGTFGPWIARLRALKGTSASMDVETAIHVWTIISKLVVEHFDRGRHLNRKEVGSLLGASPATNRRRLEVCDDLGLLESYQPESPPSGGDKRPSYTRPSTRAVTLVDAQCREWVTSFSRIQADLETYYGTQ